MRYILVPFLLEASAAELAVVINGTLTKYYFVKLKNFSSHRKGDKKLTSHYA